MAISIQTQKMLWGRAACRCCEPACRIELFEDATETDDPTLIGESCHIVAESDEGPRGNPTMPADQRDKYENLVLLCRNHHKIIDSQVEKYTVSFLKNMKCQHEAWIKEQLNYDSNKQKDEEQYGLIVDEWKRLCHLDDWQNWSSFVLSNGLPPSIWKNVYDDLFKLQGWLVNRVWPKRYKKLEDAFHNFRNVLRDFQETFCAHAEDYGNQLITKRFYQIPEWNEELYKYLSYQFEFHVDLVEDFMIELTRAANLVCDRIRENLAPNFYLKEGYLTLMVSQRETVVVEYCAEECARATPYPGLDEFYEERAKRDWCIGKGRPLNYSTITII